MPAFLPRLSVLTVNFNNRNGLERTIESVRGRDRDHVEFVVIDGGSNDGSAALLSQRATDIDRWISEPDRGTYDAMNKGLALARGEFVCFMNSGDVFGPGVLDKVIREPRDWNSFDVLCGDMVNEATGTLDRAQPAERIFTDMIGRHQAMFIRTSVHRDFPFDLRYRIAADWDVLLRMYLTGRRFARLDLCVGSFEAGGVANSRYFATIAEYTRIAWSRNHGISRLTRTVRYLWGKRRFVSVLLLQRALGRERYRRWMDRVKRQQSTAPGTQA
jgi:glycosyltransferase involved in cell wall biosynthesis